MRDKCDGYGECGKQEHKGSINFEINDIYLSAQNNDLLPSLYTATL